MNTRHFNQPDPAVIAFLALLSGMALTASAAMPSFQPLGDLPGGSVFSEASAISADGSTIVGWSKSAGGNEAFRWTSATGIQGLGHLEGDSSGAYGVSADGSTIIGTSWGQAFRWTSATGMQGLGDLPGGDFFSDARGVSADGSTIVGYSSSAASGDYAEAFRWTSATGMQGLGDLPGAEYLSAPYGVSGDGSIIVGQSISDDGAEAFIWDASHGMRSLRDVLVDDYGLDLTGWKLWLATGVSADGNVIIGHDLDSAGESHAWVVTIPEPSSLALLALAVPVLLRRQWPTRLPCCEGLQDRRLPSSKAAALRGVVNRNNVTE